MNTFRCRITTPDADRFDGEVLQLSVRGSEGDLAVMAGHIPFVTAVKAGACRVYSSEGNMRNAHCGEGLLTVTREGTHLLCSEFEFEDEATREK